MRGPTTTASDTPSAGPNNSPADSVNTVLGNGKTVTTTCAMKNASGNHGPTEVAQSRSCTALGIGTSAANAIRITIAPATVARRRPDTRLAAATTVARTARNVLATGFTGSKTTCLRVGVLDRAAGYRSVGVCRRFAA